MAALCALHPAFYTLSLHQDSSSVLSHSFSFRTRYHPYSSSAILPTIRYHLPPLPSFSRRLFLPGVSRLWEALNGSNDFRDAVLAVRRGMQLFRQGDVSGSLNEFDRAIELDPRQKAYLWQRGLTLYYLDRFEEGAEQFRLDVAQNPNDTEESIWCFLCEAQLYGIDEARRRFLEVGRDSRPVMREAYEMFKDGGDPEKLVAAFSSGNEADYFYASLYAGLYCESQNKAEGAQLHMLAACQSPYGQGFTVFVETGNPVEKIARDRSENNRAVVEVNLV